VAEHGKLVKYAEFEEEYIVTLIAVGTLDAYGISASLFIASLGRRMRQAVEDPRSTAFLRQRRLVEVQRILLPFRERGDI